MKILPINDKHGIRVYNNNGRCHIKVFDLDTNDETTSGFLLRTSDGGLELHTSVNPFIGLELNKDKGGTLKVIGIDDIGDD